MFLRFHPLCAFSPPSSKIAEAKSNCIIEYVASQKKFTVDFLTKKQKINEGEIPQYYVENSHPAIIPPEIHDLVQVEMRKRKKANRHYSGKDCFSSHIVCGECGGYYGGKV